MKNLPIVWLSDNWSEYFHTVYLNAEETGKLAGDYLVSKGHQRIAVIHESDYTGINRANGVGLALQKAGHDPKTNLLTIDDSVPLHLAVKQVIDSGCTAVWVTGEDMKVIEVNWIIQELAGKKIPQDISIMGFENPGVSEFQRPSLTTVASPLREMAEKAVDIVLSGESRKHKKVKMEVQLIERNSVINI
jgi:LacI family transcriptional regulator